MIHNVISTTDLKNVFVTFSVNGGEYSRDFDPEFLDRFLGRLLQEMQLSDPGVKCARIAFAHCLRYANDGVLDKDSGVYFDSISGSEYGVLQDLAAFLLELGSYRIQRKLISERSSLFYEPGELENVPSLSFSYQNNNTGRSLTWFHMNDCSPSSLS
jgi:hypothetical protein